MRITKKIGLAASALCVSLGHIAQANPAPRPAAAPPLTARYEWRNGTVAPPYHYEYSISLGPGSRGHMTLTPGYPRSDGKSKTYTEAFDFPPAARARLLATMRAHHVFDGDWAEATGASRPVGGGSENLEVQADGRSVTIPAFLGSPKLQADAGAVYAAINALVPKEARARLMAQQQKFQKQMTTQG